jgi:catechol 2,3-dioxygenase-like lactoylglutathione lyase family enzyme
MIKRMDHVGIVVDDLAAATAFFVELGLELEGEMPVEGRWVDRVVGLDNVRVDVAMVRTPDGHGRLELTKFHTPRTATGSATSAAQKGSSSRWPSSSAKRGRRRRPATTQSDPTAKFRTRTVERASPMGRWANQENDNGRHNRATERDHRGSKPTDQPGPVGPRPGPLGLRRQGRHTPHYPDRVHLAAERNGLVADDGQRSVWATIRSGLRLGCSSRPTRIAGPDLAGRLFRIVPVGCSAVRQLPHALPHSAGSALVYSGQSAAT